MYFLIRNVIINNQLGFQPEKCTFGMIDFFFVKIFKSMEANEFYVGVFCDLSGAFDCVNHDKLCEKLENNGIIGLALGWVSSF